MQHKIEVKKKLKNIAHGDEKMDNNYNYNVKEKS